MYKLIGSVGMAPQAQGPYVCVGHHRLNFCAQFEAIELE